MKKTPSLSSLARAYVALMSQSSQEELIRALAQEVRDHNLTHRVDQLAQEITRQILHETGQLKATVRSARHISPQTKQELIKFIRANTVAQSVELLEVTDSGLTGGIVVTTPEWEFDASIQQRLKQLVQTET